VTARPALRREHGLAALVLAFAGLAAWPWLAPATVSDRPPPSAPVAAIAAPVPASLPPLAAFAATVERPLFAPSRRPAAASVAAPGAAPAAAAHYRLIGLIGVGSERRALVADGARRLEVKPGDALGGLPVVRIEPDRLVLRSSAGEVALKLGPAATGR
jgi:hypothetical protein